MTPSRCSGFFCFVESPECDVVDPDLRAVVFYDGHCGLCHGFVKFVVARDRLGDRFDFAPIDGAEFAAKIGAERGAELGDTIVLLGADGAVRTRSNAVIAVLRSLGGWWRVMAAVMGVVPRMLRDAVYDGVARVRRRLFTRPADVCPMLPPELRSRFLL
jgi:predicted DCC family thiol-disulfide oxidoreductase YuxK